MEGESVELVIPADLALLPAVRALFRSLLDACPEGRLSSKDRTRLLLVVHEACLNAVRHAEPGNPGARVRVVFRPGPEDLVVEVRDRGPGFDPDAVPIPDPLALPEGGLGVFIMRETMDSVATRREAGEFVLSLTLRYREPAASVAWGTA